MRLYDYSHSGICEALSATPGRVYEVIRTNQKLKGNVTGWRATKWTQTDEAGNTFRAFVNDAGSVAFFGRDEVLR